MTFIVATAFFLPFFAIAVGATFLIAVLAGRLGRTSWLALLTVVATLLVTPTMGPATIAVVPVTFGWLLIPSIVTGS